MSQVHLIRFMSGKTVKRLGAAALATGLLGGAAGGQSLAQQAPPTQHKGLTVKVLGTAPAKTVEATTGLKGHILLLREITIAPGGQIARHSAAKVPGVVKMTRGTWIEGRAGGERSWTPDSPALIEDENTVHWFFNRGSEPATAIVCDIKPAK